MNAGGEEWRQAPGFPLYAVSDLGRVMRVVGGRGAVAGATLKPQPSTGPGGNGYLYVSLSQGHLGTRKDVLVHRLVAAAFHGPGHDGDQVDHINAHITDNRADNLEWVSQAENLRRRDERGVAA